MAENKFPIIVETANPKKSLTFFTKFPNENEGDVEDEEGREWDGYP